LRHLAGAVELIQRAGNRRRNHQRAHALGVGGGQRQIGGGGKCDARHSFAGGSFEREGERIARGVDGNRNGVRDGFQLLLAGLHAPADELHRRDGPSQSDQRKSGYHQRLAGKAQPIDVAAVARIFHIGDAGGIGLPRLGGEQQHGAVAGGVGVIGDHFAGRGVAYGDHPVKRLAQAIAQAANHQPALRDGKAVNVDLADARDSARNGGGQRRQIERGGVIFRFDQFGMVADDELADVRAAVGVRGLPADRPGRIAGGNGDLGGDFSRERRLQLPRLEAEPIRGRSENRFAGGAGDFELDARVVREQLHVGRPVVGSQANLNRLPRSSSRRIDIADLRLNVGGGDLTESGEGDEKGSEHACLPRGKGSLMHSHCWTSQQWHTKS
jgi:hypothetical protein